MPGPADGLPALNLGPKVGPVLSDDAQRLASLAEQFPLPGDERNTADAIVAYAVEVVPDAEHVSLTMKAPTG